MVSIAPLRFTFLFIRFLLVIRVVSISYSICIFYMNFIYFAHFFCQLTQTQWITVFVSALSVMHAVCLKPLENRYESNFVFQGHDQINREICTETKNYERKINSIGNVSWVVLNFNFESTNLGMIFFSWISQTEPLTHICVM